jgi:hypothetical protein
MKVVIAFNKLKNKHLYRKESSDEVLASFNCERERERERERKRRQNPFDRAVIVKQFLLFCRGRMAQSGGIAAARMITERKHKSNRQVQKMLIFHFTFSFSHEHR